MRPTFRSLLPPLLAAGFLCVFGTPAPAAAAPTLLLADAFSPSWSPDGDAVACAREIPGFGVQIWTAPLGGGPAVKRTVDPEDAWGPVWLPDGERILYCHFFNTETGTRYEFVIHDLTTGNGVVRGVPEFWDDPGFYLSPDGTELLYTQTQNPPETWAVNLETGATRYVGPGYGGMISPDGQWFASCTAEDSMVVRPMAGGAGVTLGYGAYGRWTRDSRYVIFTTFAPSGNPDLVAVSRDGSYREQLTDDADIEWSNDVSPDGTHLVYHKSAGDLQPSSLWLLDLELPTATHGTTWGAIKDRYR